MMTVFFAAALATACFWAIVFSVTDHFSEERVMFFVALSCFVGLVLSAVMS
jgi:hypothetical protein